jgi:hypothetical protein
MRLLLPGCDNHWTVRQLSVVDSELQRKVRVAGALSHGEAAPAAAGPTRPASRSGLLAQLVPARLDCAPSAEDFSMVNLSDEDARVANLRLQTLHSESP